MPTTHIKTFRAGDSILSQYIDTSNDATHYIDNMSNHKAMTVDNSGNVTIRATKFDLVIKGKFRYAPNDTWMFEADDKAHEYLNLLTHTTDLLEGEIQLVKLLFTLGIITNIEPD